MTGQPVTQPGRIVKFLRKDRALDFIPDDRLKTIISAVFNLRAPKAWQDFCQEPSRHKFKDGRDIYRFIDEQDFIALTNNRDAQRQSNPTTLPPHYSE